jgi:hypothetical protein
MNTDVLLPYHSNEIEYPDVLPGAWRVCDRAQLSGGASSVVIRGGFLWQNEVGAKSNVEIEFRCRAPRNELEVQVWAGFRARSRHDRYVVALRGGNNNHIYLARYGSGGRQRFLGIAPLDIKPEVGEWYRLRVVLWERRIQVYLDDRVAPSIDVEDNEEGWTEGSVVLGGGYCEAEFASVDVRDLSEPPVLIEEVHESIPSSSPLTVYHPLKLREFSEGRTEVSLDGQWRFQPAECIDSDRPEDPALDDRDWLTMDVPNLWTPMLCWLHGETTFNEFEGVSRSKGVNDKLWVAEMERLCSYGFDWQRTQVAWYRHHLHLPDEIEGRRFELCFDAVAKACEIWFNGQLAGTHVGMFGEIRCDITDFVRSGVNVLAVKVLRQPESASQEDDRIVGVAESVEVTQGMLSSLPRAMINHDPAGIWQPVRLFVTGQAYVRDVYIQPSLDTARLDLDIGALDSVGHEIVTVGYVVRERGSGDILAEAAQALQQPVNCLSAARIDLPQVQPKLWHPDRPHLYELEITLRCGELLWDRWTDTFGFRTFTVEGNRFLLNGSPYWLRGANHFPHGLAPNDRDLARRFISLAREGNVRATRFHVAPLTKAWAEEADRQGLLVSFEGIWPWLMLKGDLPDASLLDVWREDFTALIRKYRNHPSIGLWTINNEMKFYIFDQDNHELLRRKWAVVSGMIQTVRQLDPTRPVVADSGYVRGRHLDNYNAIVRVGNFDDGDVDDIHEYYGWYHPSFSTALEGDFTHGIASPDRPFISQELSSGYPRNDDGLPTRFYLFKHGTPQALVGDYAFEHQNPRYFQERLGYIIKNTGEAIRRANRDDTAGVMHFAYLTWFKDVHDADEVLPWTAPYEAIRQCLQPVLISAEFFGRHFFGEDELALCLHLINDSEHAQTLVPGLVEWEVLTSDGNTLERGQLASPELPYYENRQVHARIIFPRVSSDLGRMDVILRLRLRVGSESVAENDYAITLASSDWALATANLALLQRGRAQLGLYDPGGNYQELFSELGLTQLDDLNALCPELLPMLVVVGDVSVSENGLFLTRYVRAGGKLLLLNVGEVLCDWLPDHVAAWRRVDGQIVNMHLPESSVFDGIEPLDLAWCHCGADQLPRTCDAVFEVKEQNPDVTVLADFCDFHNYLDHPSDITRYSGSPLFECRVGEGCLLSCELNADAIKHDPIARRLFGNAIARLCREL